MMQVFNRWNSFDRYLAYPTNIPQFILSCETTYRSEYANALSQPMGKISVTLA